MLPDGTHSALTEYLLFARLYFRNVVYTDVCVTTVLTLRPESGSITIPSLQISKLRCRDEK
jgi:hypothetical protein